MSTHAPMCVTYAADDYYSRFLGISMLSLFKANTAAEAIEVFILDSGIQPENRARLESIGAEYGRALHFIDVQERIGSLNLNMGARKMPVAAYARLFLGSLLPESFDRALYLDCDIIVCDDLSALYETELDDALIAGVQDTVDQFYLKVIGLEEGCLYVNSGMLLLNIAAWRAERIEERFMAFIDRFGGNVPHHDQGILNGVCGKRRVILPLRYNVTSNVYSFTAAMIRRMYDLTVYYLSAEVLAAREHPAILHFTIGLTGRPWEENCSHPMKEKYMLAANQSPWSGAPLLPDQTKKSVRLTAWARRHLPENVFASIYRSTNWILHQRK